MKKAQTQFFNDASSHKGAVLLSIMIFGVIFAIVITSLIRFSNNSRRLSHADELTHESRWAAQSLLNHAMAQVQGHLLFNPYPMDGAFSPGHAGTVTLHQEVIDFYGDNLFSRLIGLEGFSPLHFYDNPENFPSGVIARIRSADPQIVNLSPDSLLPEEARSTTADVREIVAFAKATVLSPILGERTSYARQTLQSIDRSLYRYAVFYNDELELWPGENMTFSGGPIHSNSNVFLGVADNAIMEIHNQVMSAGDFFLRRHPGRSQSNIEGEVLLRDFSQPDSSLYLRDLSDTTVWGGLLDSRLADFRALASQYLHGGLMTQEHGIAGITPAGFEGLEQLLATTGNFNHHLIRPISPNQNFDDGFFTDEQKSLLRDVETEKWSYQSDLIIRLIPGTDSEDDMVEVLRPRRDAEGRILVHPVHGSPQFDSIEVLDGEEFFSVEPYAPEMQQVLDSEGEPMYDSNGEPVLERVPETTVSGLFDYRQARNSESNSEGEINLLRFDMGQFKTFTENLLERDVHIERLEGIYFELPEAPPMDPRGDLIIPADPRWALQIHNASTLPTGRRTDSDGRIIGDPAGLTFATNGAMYVQGPFNSPGGGGDATTPEDITTFGRQKDAEMPVALVADAITLLSSDWDNTNSRRANINHRRAEDTIFSTALVTGIVPTADGNYSGGVENFPRLLERWSNKDLTIRGSIISLFDSESHVAPWSWGGSIYQAPNRHWGYHSGFISAPPRPFRGVTSFRRVYFQEMNGPEFYEQIKRLRNGEVDL